MNKLINTYAKFILKIENVPTYWHPLRFILHWVTLPFKLLVIGGLGTYQILKQTLHTSRHIPEATLENKKKYINSVFRKLPIARAINDELYCPRVPYYERPNGYNHNIDHQSAWHGVYTFLMSRIGKRNGFQELSMSKHMKEHNLYRGYTFDGRTNANTVSGDMLIGTSLSLLNVRGSAMEGVVSQGSTGDVLKDKFDEMVVHLIENDYALLEGGVPEDGPERELYDIELARHKNVKDMVKIKSARGMWQPGLETVGAQALTVLAAVRVADKKCGSITPKRAYTTLLYRYGYGILSLFPTAFTAANRGYYNDNNCMAALYILAKLADTKLGRLFWTLPMVYVFLLSYRTRNGYFTGMVLDVAPFLNKVLTYHKSQCINYLYEHDPITYSRDNGIELNTYGKLLPVRFNETNQGEFLHDHEAKLFMNQVGEEIIRTDNCHSGLGWMASSILLEPELVKEALSE